MNRKQLHSMESIVFISMAAVICGARTWDDIEDFGNDRIDWIDRYLDLPNGIPSHDTFNRFFSLLDPEIFESCFRGWVADVMARVDAPIDDQGNPIPDVISVDGKTIRGSRSFEKSPIHMVSAWSKQHRVTLGQLATAEKSNEITAIPQLLDALFLEGSIVTIDAMGCQSDIAEKIISKNADYVLAVKGNQPLLQEGVIDSFRFLKPVDTWEQDDFGHGRIERRTCSVITDLSMIENIDAWKNARCVVSIQADCYFKSTGETSTQTRYYITSLPPDARQIERAVRDHWGIENQLHWMLDAGLDEDHSRKRNRNAVVNWSLLQKIALMKLRRETTFTKGLPSKQLKAGRNIDYLMLVMAA